MRTDQPTSAPDVPAADRRKVLDLLNEAVSAEYHSFVGYVIGSNPFVVPGTEKDLDTLQRIRDEENDLVRALLLQLRRFRAGPTIRAFRWWKHDLNFLGLDFLVIRAGAIAKDDVARVEKTIAALPDDEELRATFQSILAAKRRHADELGKLAAQRAKERQARRDAARAVTAIPLKKGAAAAPAAAAKPAAPAAGAPKAPALPGAPKAPALPGAPKPPSPPLPPGAAKPSAPPLPPGMKLPGAPAAPAAPKPPAAPAAPAAPPAPPASSGGAPKAPPLPPGFKLPPKPGA